MPKKQPARILVFLIGIAGLLSMAFAHDPARQPATRPMGLGIKTSRNEGRHKGDGTNRVESTDAEANATHHSEISAKGWWSALKRVVVRFNEDRLMTEAAGVTFYSLLAVFPAMATLVSLYGLVANPLAVNSQLKYLNGVVPSGSLDIIRDELKSLTANGTTVLGFGFLIGFVTSLWSANQGVKALFDALNIVYHEKEKRGYIRFTGLCLLFTLGAILFIMTAIFCIAVVPLALKYLGLDEASAGLIAIGRWPVLMAILTFLLALIYRYGPSREQARWQWLSWGSAFAAVTWLIASIAFSYYVANFGSYNKTYGSLGAVIGLMTWIWISTIIVLLGAELNAELEQQTSRDSTTGPELTMGQRGAFKADNRA
jgi:membrane protein